MKEPKHPMQPVVFDKHGTARFKKNAIVEFLLENGPHNMNTLIRTEFTEEDRQQFAQLIGYSVSGFGELPYTSDEAYERAQREVAKAKQRANGQ